MDDITFQESRTAGGQLGPTEFAVHRLALAAQRPRAAGGRTRGTVRPLGEATRPVRRSCLPGRPWGSAGHRTITSSPWRRLAPDLVAGIPGRWPQSSRREAGPGSSQGMVPDQLSLCSRDGLCGRYRGNRPQCRRLSAGRRGLWSSRADGRRRVGGSRDSLGESDRPSAR